jgi:hypothetical protein
MTARRHVLGALFMGAVASALIATGALRAPSAEAKTKKAEDGLHYAHSFAEAMKEAKERNVLVFATFHKDH